ncbi:SDR family NAD(P)-dependent oxidoreductase [Nocardioides humi]|uniref:SDR family NAD(P)-dependent oxidoreductase n=1 Tax=Nocardioides humi TaxID=449461 RepID=A0ABN2AGC8_9ACTN|nr:SDR family NAD(P)-dependent oxidoreductase [Nocardioides humi]
MAQRWQRFGFDSTVDDVVAGVDLTGRRAVVTGATSGIGVETARALALAGAEVTLAVRRPDAARDVARAITEAVPGARLDVARLDLADLATVRAFAASYDAPLDVLVNNAGIMALPRLERTSYGWELQLATNFLGHHALVAGLSDRLREGARVVCLSSAAHLRSPVVHDDLHFRFRPYDPWLAYGQSKTADILLAVETRRRLGDRGVRAFAVHPGIIHTELQRHIDWDTTDLPLKSPAQGASTSVLVATAPELAEGPVADLPVYWQDCAPAPVVSSRPRDYSGGVAPYALDAEAASRLAEIADRVLADL